MPTDDLPRIDALKCDHCGKPATHRILTPQGYAPYGACFAHLAATASSAHAAWVTQQRQAQEVANLRVRDFIAKAMDEIQKANDFPKPPMCVTEEIR